jgi:hypothetical protein
MPVFCQTANSGAGPVSDVNANTAYVPSLAITNMPLSFNTKYGGQPGGTNFVQGGGRGNSFGNPMGMVEMFTNRLGLKLPRFGYDGIKGMNFQAGLITNSRQPKIGASLSMTHGFNISAGYGINSVNKFGYAPTTRNQGIQISAGYRLFRKK